MCAKIKNILRIVCYHQGRVVNDLTVELVQSIREAESKAGAITRAARQKARQAVKQAEENATLLVREAVAAAEKEADKLVVAAAAEARAEAGPQAEAGRKEIGRLEEQARARLPQAVALITGRIVQSHAHH